VRAIATTMMFFPSCFCCIFFVCHQHHHHQRICAIHLQSLLRGCECHELLRCRQLPFVYRAGGECGLAALFWGIIPACATGTSRWCFRGRRIASYGADGKGKAFAKGMGPFFHHCLSYLLSWDTRGEEKCEDDSDDDENFFLALPQDKKIVEIIAIIDLQPLCPHLPQ